MHILRSSLAYSTTPYFALWEVFRHQKRIRLRRIWECHDCHEGVVSPGIYINIHGETIKIDPKSLDPNTEVMRFWPSFPGPDRIHRTCFSTSIRLSLHKKQRFIRESRQGGPWFQHSIIPCRRHKTSVVKSYMISIYYRNSETLIMRPLFKYFIVRLEEN